jgi:hypothetical protein
MACCGDSCCSATGGSTLTERYQLVMIVISILDFDSRRGLNGISTKTQTSKLHAYLVKARGETS